MPTVRHDAFFRRHPVFTGEELADHLSSRGQVGERTQESLVAYHIRTGRLVRVRRGLFAVIPPGDDSVTYPIDPYLIVSRLTPDSILSHHTALEFHGRAYSVWQQFTYLASRPPKTFTFREQVYLGTKFPEALVRSDKTDFNVLSEERSGMSLRVTGLERTLVDVLDRPFLSGGWEEVWRSLEAVEFFDIDKVLEYALLLENSTTASKVGLYLAQHLEELMVEESHLATLRDQRPQQPHYIDRRSDGRGTLMSEWNLIVPAEVVARSWRELE